MGIFQEFKTFALKGNVVDMAVGVIIGSAFGKIISSFVTDVLMPPLGMLIGGVDFSGLFINLTSIPVSTPEEAQELGIPVIAYGRFLNNVADFLIIAFVIFTVIRQINRFSAKKSTPPARSCPYCRENIAVEATRCPHCTAVLTESA